MAVAAETNYLRPPESEIYGRSLSTIRRLGAFMIQNMPEESIASPEADQAKVEFYTSVEEGFGTDMELGGGLEVRDFDDRLVIDGRVMAKDLKTSISAMTEAGLTCAIETERKDQRFSPQLVRSKWDHQNALIVDEMARGEIGYNTRIVISPFPEEAAAQSGNEYWRNIGYVPHLKRGFVQLYHAHGDKVISGSLSFDGSNKQQLRDVFSQLGVEIPEREVTDNWLKYAITGNLSEDKAKALATAIADKSGDPSYKKNTNTVDVTKQYKPIMERAFNESYIHICESLSRGRQTEGARKLIYQFANTAHNFNERYASALYKMRATSEQFTDDDSIVLHELLVYSTIEMMRSLHFQKVAGGSGVTNEYDGAHSVAANLRSADPAIFQNMLSGFGSDGAKNNRTYSACGLSISLGENEPKNNPQSEFGGVDRTRDLDSDELGSRWFTCAKGHQNWRRVPNVPEKNCKTCGTDVSCQAPPPKPKPSQKLTWKVVFGGAEAKAKPERKKLKIVLPVGKQALAPLV